MLVNGSLQRFPLALGAALLLIASAQPVRARAAGAVPQPASQAAPAAGAAAKTAQPPVEWLTDDEGRSYRLEPLPKAQGAKLGPDRVRTMWGVAADLAREDEQFFYIKVYKTAPAPVSKTPAKPSATAKSAAAARVTEPLPAIVRRLRWTPLGAGLPTSGQWRESLVLVDVNGDGRLDIVTSPARKTMRPPSVFINGGTSWTRSTAFTFPDRFYDYGGIAAGDLNRDGKLDLVLAEHLRGLIALQGGEGGKFADASKGLPFAEHANMPAFSSRNVVLTDCNGDGRLDIVALGEGPRMPSGGGAAGTDTNIATGIGTFVQEEDGSWTPKLQVERSGLFGAALATANVDGDGHPDLVVAPGVLGDTRLVHHGDGACGWKAETVDAARPRSYISTVAAGDLDGDGRDELIVGYTEFANETPTYGVDVLTRDAGGQWTRRALSRETGRGRITAIAAGDLDGDGKPDVVAVGEQGAVSIFIGNGKGGFVREGQSLESPGGCSGASVTIADLDRDGMADIVVGYAQEGSSATPGACPTEGGITAWKTQRAAAQTPGATGGAAPRKR
jgi:hypothetical protein